MPGGTTHPPNSPKRKGPLVQCRFYNVPTLRPFPEVRQVAVPLPVGEGGATASGLTRRVRVTVFAAIWTLARRVFS